MSNKLEKEFRVNAQKIFGSDAGKQVLAVLKTMYVDVSSLGASPELTHYNLGKKELVQSLIRLMAEPAELEDIKIIHETSIKT